MQDTDPLFQLFYRNILRIAIHEERDERVLHGASVEVWREAVREILSRQIIRRANVDGGLVDSTRGFIAACEGHSYATTRFPSQYAELLAKDTAEQIRLLGRRGAEPDGVDSEENEDSFDELARAGARQPERPQGLAALTSWRNR